MFERIKTRIGHAYGSLLLHIMSFGASRLFQYVHIYDGDGVVEGVAFTNDIDYLTHAADYEYGHGIVSWSEGYARGYEVGTTDGYFDGWYDGTHSQPDSGSYIEGYEHGREDANVDYDEGYTAGYDMGWDDASCASIGIPVDKSPAVKAYVGYDEDEYDYDHSPTPFTYPDEHYYYEDDNLRVGLND